MSDTNDILRKLAAQAGGEAALSALERALSSADGRRAVSSLSASHEALLRAAADRHDREQRNIHIKVVVAAHMIDGKRRKSAADVIRVIGMITEMEHGVRLFALDGVSHRHVIPMRV